MRVQLAFNWLVRTLFPMSNSLVTTKVGITAIWSQLAQYSPQMPPQMPNLGTMRTYVEPHMSLAECFDTGKSEAWK